jgi:hypothetical protein
MTTMSKQPLKFEGVTTILCWCTPCRRKTWQHVAHTVYRTYRTSRATCRSDFATLPPEPLQE